MEVIIIILILLSLAQYTEKDKGLFGWGIELGGLFDNLKVNVDKYEDVIKKFKEIEDFEEYTDSGVTNWDAIAKSIKGCDETALAYFKSLDDGKGTIDQASASIDGLSKYLKKSGNSFKKFKTTLLNTALNAGIMLGISAIISGLVEIAQAADKARDKAQELGESFKNAKSDINGYKSEINELHKTIDDSSSSIEETSDARKRLMEIQSELIDKYGYEQSAINDITNAINEEADALDNLLENEWKRTKNQFNEAGFWGDAANFVSDYTDQIDRMNDVMNGTANQNAVGKAASSYFDNLSFGTMIKNSAVNTIPGALVDYYYSTIKDFIDSEDKSITRILKAPEKYIKKRFGKLDNEIDKANYEGIQVSIDGIPDKDSKKYKEFLNILEDAGYKDNIINGAIVLNGDSIYQVYDQVQDLQEIVEDLDVPKEFAKSLSKNASEMEKNITAYREIFNEEVLKTEIMPDEKLSEAWKHMQEAYSEYQEAFASNDENVIDAKIKEMSEVFDTVYESGNQNVIDFFNNMFPEIQSLVAEWDFKVKFSPDGDGMEQGIEDILEKFAKHNKLTKEEFLNQLENGFRFDSEKEPVTVEELLNFDPRAETSERRKAYAKLKEKAKDLHFDDVSDLIKLLEELGYIRSEKYNKLVDTFGQENIDKIPQEDLQFAYKIDNIGDLSFDELLFKIRDVKSAAKEPLSFSDSISKVEALSKGLDQLDKIYADVLDKEDFDWSSMLNNKDFKETFGTDGLKEEYDNFIQTISNNKDDIDACQDSFNRLATAYINSTDAMQGLSKETEDATVELLKQKGIANAEAVVTARLAAQEAFLAERKRNAKIVSSDLESATWDEIAAVAAEGEASEETRVYLANLALEKLDFTNNPIDTDADVDAICNIAEAAGKSEEYVTALRAALVNLMNINQSIASSKNPTEKMALLGLSAAMQGDIDRYIAEIQNEINDKINLDTIRTQFKGGKDTKSAKDKADKEAEKEFKETYNWIETAINRIERLVSRLKLKADSAYKSWTSRNNSLKEEISAVRNEIELQQRAYERYMQQADSVGLSSDWAEKVRNGKVDIKTVTDEDLSKKIKEYQEWYEKALDCQDAVDSLNETVSDLYKNAFDNVSSQYDKILSAIEHQKSMLDEYLSQADQNDYGTFDQNHNSLVKSIGLYQNLLAQEQQNIEQLGRENIMVS